MARCSRVGGHRGGAGGGGRGLMRGSGGPPGSACRDIHKVSTATQFLHTRVSLVCCFFRLYKQARYV